MSFHLLNLTRRSSIGIFKQQNRSLASFKDFFKKNKDTKETTADLDEFSAANEALIPDKVLSNEFASLKDRSVTRLVHQKAYRPGDNIENELKQIVKIAFGERFKEDSYLNLPLNERGIRFQVLSGCISKFKHDISNTTLNDLQTVSDLLNYFTTPVNDTNALESLQQRTDLPKNLHINVEYTRFDSKTDTMFNKVDAFPDRSTYTSSLWYSKKYKPVVKKKEWFSK